MATGWIVSLALAVGLACGQSAPSAPKTYPGHGTVTAVDAGQRKVTLAHDDIPGLMIAMTMPFDVAPGVVLEGLEPGTVVDFEVVRSGASGYTITSLVRAGPEASR